MNMKGNEIMADEVKVQEEATETVMEVTETPMTEAQKAELANAEKRSGIKETATDEHAIATSKDAEAPVVDVGPSYFIEETDRHRVELDVMYDKKNGRVVSVSRTGIGIDFTQFGYFGHRQEWFEFSIPTYEDIAIYRQRCSAYRREAGKILVDSNQMRSFYLVWHLKDWSLTGKDGSKVPLTFNKEGALDENSIKRTNRVPPAIVDVLLTVFEKDLAIT